MNTNKHIGSNFDDFLEEEGILDEVDAIAIKRVFVYHLMQIMETEKISKSKLAKKLDTSRTQLDRLLDPTNTALTLQTMLKCAQLAGKKLEISLV